MKIPSAASTHIRVVRVVREHKVVKNFSKCLSSFDVLFDRQLELQKEITTSRAVMNVSDSTASFTFRIPDS